VQGLRNCRKLLRHKSNRKVIKSQYREMKNLYTLYHLHRLNTVVNLGMLGKISSYPTYPIAVILKMAMHLEDPERTATWRRHTTTRWASMTRPRSTPRPRSATASTVTSTQPPRISTRTSEAVAPRARGVRSPRPLGSCSANATPIAPIEATSEVGIVSSATTEEPAGAGPALRKVIIHEDFICCFTRFGARYTHRVQSGHARGIGSNQPAPEGTRLRRGRKDVQAKRASDVNHSPSGRDERSRDRYRARQKLRGGRHAQFRRRTRSSCFALLKGSD